MAARGPVIVRSLVRSGRTHWVYDDQGRGTKVEEWHPEWTEEAGSWQAARSIAESAASPDDYIAWTDEDGQRYVDIDGPLWRAERDKAFYLGLVDEAQEHLKALKRLIRSGDPLGSAQLPDVAELLQQKPPEPARW